MIKSSFKISSYIRSGSALKNVFHLCSHHYEKKIKVNDMFYLCRKFCMQTEEVPLKFIRNFSIIAHVDHGKSTLADRILEITGAIVESKNNKQVLDRLPVEKERGITVKAVAASLNYTYHDVNYQLNLIDTPGHNDFSNEVSRSLSACQGVILLIDANEGVQAQTIANFYLAFTKELTIIPVLNKIDLKNANPDKVEAELHTLFDFKPSKIHRISAKTGFGVEELLKLVIETIPPPKVQRDAPFEALIIDSWHDRYRGYILFIYVKNGLLEVGHEIESSCTGRSYQIKTLAMLRPQEVTVKKLFAGQMGVISCNMRVVTEAIVGDTIFAKGSNIKNIEVLERPKPKVFAGLFPRNQAEHGDLKSAIEKLLVNDSSVSVTLETSPALGYGWRLGFLGLLHLDVFRQRLEQEFETEAVLTAPSVTYKLKISGTKNIKNYGGEELIIKNPAQFPDTSIIKEIFEPMILATIITPIEHLQQILDDCTDRRGYEKESVILDKNRMMLKLVMPLSEIILDFNDTLKRISSGYASFDYEDYGYAPAPLEKVTILLNGKEVEELTTIVHPDRLNQFTRSLVVKLKEMIPRQQISITIQAVVRGKILARETVKPYRKDITAKLHGGDITRKMKLVRAQNEGKKKMRQFANIHLPRDIVIDVLRHS